MTIRPVMGPTIILFFHPLATLNTKEDIFGPESRIWSLQTQSNELFHAKDKPKLLVLPEAIIHSTLLLSRGSSSFHGILA